MDIEPALRYPVTINDVPEPILEFILSHLSPYKDLLECRSVSKNWYRISKNVIKNLARCFLTYDIVAQTRLDWFHFAPSTGPTISARYSHAACYHECSMYIFGGCTVNSTTFNDLWRFDLAKRVWYRPITKGTYPPPKACSTILPYGNKLIVFGGWSHGAPSSILRNESQIFNHVHTFDIRDAIWSTAPSSPGPHLAGHTASIWRCQQSQQDFMIVFGGLKMEPEEFHNSTPTNDVFLYSLSTGVWITVPTNHQKPSPRYAHSQIIVNESYIMIMGGCRGPKNLLSDMWLLEIGNLLDLSVAWNWIPIKDDTISMPHLTFHPACRMNDVIVVINKRKRPRPRGSYSNSSSSSSEPKPPAAPTAPPVTSPPIRENFSKSQLKTNGLPNKNRDRQLAVLQRMEDKMKLSSARSACANSHDDESQPNLIQSKTVVSKRNRSCSQMVLFAISIRDIIDHRRGAWKIIETFPDATSSMGDFILYSLIPGRAELILFGGVSKVDNEINTTNPMSNSVHVIQAQKCVT